MQSGPIFINRLLESTVPVFGLFQRSTHDLFSISVEITPLTHVRLIIDPPLFFSSTGLMSQPVGAFVISIFRRPRAAYRYLAQQEEQVCK